MAAPPVPPGTNDPVFRKQLEFRKMLNRVSEHLSADNLKALKHLCFDIVPDAKRETLEVGNDLFAVLIEQNLINYENTALLCELLESVQRKDLVQEVTKFIEAVDAPIPSKPSASNMDIHFLRTIAGEVGKDWKMLARYLGLDELQISSIHQANFADLHEASLQSLLRWKTTSPNASAKQLKRALVEMKLMSIVHKYFDGV